MAPTRRKGANKAAAAAARRKWKDGDLVLAKLKGFPAWPATVSKPDKWGYPADKKKIVVQFFGCEQIAFCNPTDIEEFTEEKKASLLVKPQGKGADFVHALNELISCFEKLKKQDQASSANGTVETEITDKNNLQEPLPVSTKDEDPVATCDPLSAGTTSNLDSLTEAAVAAAEDAFQNEDMQVVEKPSNLAFTETSVSDTYLTNKTDVVQSQNGGSHSQRIKPARGLRSSRIDSSRLRSTTMPSINSSRTSMCLHASASEDKSLRRSRRIIKCSDDSEGQDVDSLAFLASDCGEENNSEMMSVDSGTLSINDGSTVDSVSNLGVAEGPFAENNKGQTELIGKLGFQSNNVIRKKRKPNRKRHNNGTVDAAKPDIVTSDADQLKTVCVLPSFDEKPAQKHDMDDGDEHLPLFKRARVRMGRPSPAAEEEFTLVHKEEITSEVPENHSVQSELSICEVDAPAKSDCAPVKEEPSLSSLSHLCPVNKPTFCETRKNFVDGEAALPPSKRLHRALEAMSANVAEDCHRTSSCLPAGNSQSNGYCTSSSLECSEMPAGKKYVIESGSGVVEDLSNGDSTLSASELFVGSNVERSENGADTIAVVSHCAKTVGADDKNHELCKGSYDQGGDDTEGMKKSPFVEVSSEVNAIPECHLKLDSITLDGQFVNLNCCAPVNQCKTRCKKLNEAGTGGDPDTLQKHLDSTFAQDIAGGSPNLDTGYGLKSDYSVGNEARRENDLPAENNQDSKMSEFVEQSRPASLNSKTMHPVTPVEDNIVSLPQSSSPTDGPDSVPRASPPSYSVCNMSAFGINKPLGNAKSSCPDVQLHLEKAKLAAKFSSKLEALSSFEATIKSLTRTKESIGRATRLAIDCAKFGFAAKVVEILAHNLEIELSLHKKVDLFFLVDSITQSSRGIKGDGGVYPSAIQALLPRLLLAAAPPSSSNHENHRQCLKVLRVWQKRKILPEPTIRHHIRELDAFCGSYPTMSSNRSLRNERAFDDPIREMEGMQVDEYGSNSNIQLPGLCMPPMMRDDDEKSDSDGESFEAVTPEHNNVDNLDGERTMIFAVGRRRHILEDVDGELEMEDVAPFCEDEIITRLDQTQMSHQQPDSNNGDVPPRLPLPSPLQPTDFPPVVLSSASNGPNSKSYSNSQKFSGNLHEPVLQTSNSRNANGAHSNSDQSNEGYGKSFHLRPPHPALSNQFLYVQERVQSQRDISGPNRFHSRNSDNGNKFTQHDNIGESWRPPFPSISGPCYNDGPRMANAPPVSYPREPPSFHNRWSFPSRPMNHRHFNPYGPPSDGPIPVANRGPNYWRPR